ncbi:MAG: hypothetical protein EXR07_20625 [Acetobacteraceae bacterium]|nr:hypothetical protein [Acetobacteraceae bacterium]
MRDRTVLIVTRKFDPHADQVIGDLQRRGAPFFRLNTDDFHTDYRVTADGADGSFTFDDQWGRSLRFPNETRSVWYRKPIDPAAPPSVGDIAARAVILQETREFLTYLSTGTRIPWINNPHANIAAAREFPQIGLARSLGLRVPRTLVTNDPAQARAFHDALDGRLLCKSMKAVGYEEGDGFHPMFSRKVTPEEFERHAEQLSFCPSLLQEYIDKAHELRITVIGGAIFCCRIDSQAVRGAETDWRRVDPFQVPHEIVPLDTAVGSALITMLERYGLSFGTFDMIVTPAGEYVFLELNPNGQWLWIESITGARMSEAMAGLLAG